MDTELNDLRNRLEHRMHAGEIDEIASLAHENTNADLREDIFRMTMDENDRVAYNALWCLSHMPHSNAKWLRTKHNRMIDRLLACRNTSHRRLLLTLLERNFDTKAPLRTDFLDYCLDTINSTLPYAQRALCMKLAYVQCRAIPELLSELREVLELTAYGHSSPGILSARRNILKKMDRHARNTAPTDSRT